MALVICRESTILVPGSTPSLINPIGATFMEHVGTDCCEESQMVKCSRCGKGMGSASVCPHCGFGPSQSVMGRTAGRMAKLTGEALETGVKVTETVAKEVKPAVKAVVEVGKRGVSKAKKETLKVAKSLKDEGT